MKFYIFLLLGCCAFIGKAQDSKVNLSAAEVTFTYVSKDVSGSIAGFNSTSILDFNALDTSLFKGSVQTETLKTGNSIRDWSLRRSKYFNADKYPKISFESTSIQQNGNTYLVNGNLTLKGITKPIQWEFTRTDKKIVGTTTLFSSDFNIKIKKKREDNKVRVTLTAQLE